MTHGTPIKLRQHFVVGIAEQTGCRAAKACTDLRKRGIGDGLRQSAAQDPQVLCGRRGRGDEGQARPLRCLREDTHARDTVGIEAQGVAEGYAVDRRDIRLPLETASMLAR